MVSTAPEAAKLDPVMEVSTDCQTAVTVATISPLLRLATTSRSVVVMVSLVASLPMMGAGKRRWP
jgi:hypothetical protein